MRNLRLDYECDNCFTRTTRCVTLADRDEQECECGARLVRLPHFSSVVIGIPAGFKTMFSDVHGIPGSPQREKFEKDVKSGEVVYAGPGSRWI